MRVKLGPYDPRSSALLNNLKFTTSLKTHECAMKLSEWLPQIDPQTTEICPKQLNVTMFMSKVMSESVSDTLVIEKLSF